MVRKRAEQGPTWRDGCLSTGPLGQPIVGAHEQTPKIKREAEQEPEPHNGRERGNRERKAERQRERGRETQKRQRDKTAAPKLIAAS